MPADLLVGSFHSHLQILTFEPSVPSLELYTVTKPEFDRYTWITAHPQHQNIFYAAQSGAGGQGGQLSTIKVSRGAAPKEPGDGVPDGFVLDILETVSTGGSDPCHVGIAPDGSQLGIANYASSTVSTYNLSGSGNLLGDAYVTHDLTQDAHTGPNKERQEAPHPHGCFYTDNNDLLVPDLGSDRVRVIGSSDRVYKSLAGAGPRHAAFHPHGDVMYVLNELGNTVTVHHLSQPAIDPAILKRFSILPTDCRKPSGQGMSASEVLLSEDARTMYVTNRGEDHPQGDAIVWFALGEQGEAPMRQGDVRTGLQNLRGAGLFQADGKRYLITGTRAGKGSVVFEREPEHGNLIEVVRNDSVTQSSCFVPLP